MKAMVLGAGRGTRLGEIGARLPKVLVDIGGRPLLERQLDYLAKEGVDKVVVNAFHLSQAIEDFAAGYTGPLDVVVSVEPELLGTGGGVRAALDELGQDPFFVLYGDVIVDAPLVPILNSHRRAGAAVTLTVYETDYVAGKGLVEVGHDGVVVGFVEKGDGHPTPALVNAGLYVVDPTDLERWPAGAVFDFGYDLFPQLLASGRQLHAYRLAASVIDIGTPEGLEAGRALYTA